MKVGEAIKILKQLNPDSEVALEFPDTNDRAWKRFLDGRNDDPDWTDNRETTR